MSGLARICRMYGSMEAVDANGKKVIWLWDYVNEKPRLKSEMTKEEIKASMGLSDRQIHRQLKLMGIKKKNGKERQ